MYNTTMITNFILGAIMIGAGVSTQAQCPDTMPKSAYAHAEKFLGFNTQQYVDNAPVKANWITDTRFWYKNLTSRGSEYVLVDVEKGTRQPAFDHRKMAAALSTTTGKQYSEHKLPIQALQWSAGGITAIYTVDNITYTCNLPSYTCAASVAQDSHSSRRGTRNEVVSPDGKKAAFIKDFNLYMRDLATGKITQLTTDGSKNYGYATDNAGWKTTDRPVLSWSPDSKKIATFKQDERHVKDMYLVTTNVGAPELKAWKYPLPGDSAVIMIERVIINTEIPKVIKLQVPPDPHRGTLSDDISSSGTFDDVDWSDDSQQLAFVSTSRDHKHEKLRIADARTGVVREVFEEVVPTQFESGQDMINWQYLAKSNEIIWFSERSDWGHLYLYDATTGKLKNQITSGSWAVTQLLKVDEQKRTIYFYAGNREPGNPYFRYLYKADLNGKNLTLLTPEPGNHNIEFSPDERYFVDTYSQPDKPAISVVRTLDGRLVKSLEQTDVSRLSATGWKPPVPFSVLAADGKTDIYGLMFTPSRLDTTQKYPVINYIYPGPQGGSIGNWSFMASRGDHQALAELGFIVILIEGTSNPLRSKSYHDMNYGNIADNTLPDQIAGIRQLSQRHRYIDTTKVGVWGHSGGGFATAAAMFRYPDFYKVGISESGNHDNRNYEDDWGERYIGLLKKNADGTDNYTAQANQVYAKNLKGKLMLAHGLMDNNVPPYNTFLVVDALIKANKDFDLIVFPHAAHGFGVDSYYMMRRRWDYFVKHLLGMTPPDTYQIKPAADPREILR